MDEGYRQYLREEIAAFRKEGHRFLDGEITRAEFKGKSGGMGCYSQKDGTHFMIRLRTPSGVVSKEHRKLILGYAKACGLERIHVTTRQAVQLHDLSIDQVCDVMADALEHNLFTRGGGGNFPRNVALSPLAGVDPKELFDVTPYALQVGSYFLDRAVGYHLPRKLKVAFSSGPDDTAFATVNDMGFIPQKQDGRLYFRLWLAGGMGGGPAVGLPFDELVKPEEVLYYIEAMVRLFMAEGDYEHKAKARIRFIPRRMGVEAFMDCYRGYVKQAKEECGFEGIVPTEEAPQSWQAEPLGRGTDAESIVFAQRQPGRYTVALHPLCGQISVKDWEALDRFLDACQNPEMRLSMAEEIYVRGLTKEEAARLLAQTETTMKRAAVDRSVSCIGTPTCQIGIMASQQLCQRIVESVEASGAGKELLPQISISGCPNSCSRHPVAGLGFAGKIKAVDGERVESFDCFAQGAVGVGKTRLAQQLGTVPAEKIPELVVALGQRLEALQMDYESYVDGHMDELKALVDTYAI